MKCSIWQLTFENFLIVNTGKIDAIVNDRKKKNTKGLGFEVEPLQFVIARPDQQYTR